jgi:two-component system chemotaxis response regulator CheB
LVKELPSDLKATLFVVLHLAPASRAWLVEELQRATDLTVEAPNREHAIKLRHVYVASPDRHLIVRKGKVVSSRGPRENLWRPALDVSFRTAAVAYGSRVIGILLSGELDDGTAGLQAIKACGGIVIVQDPQDAAFPAMPATALANVHVDHRVQLADMAALLIRLTKATAGPSIPVSDELRREAQMAEEEADTAALHDGQEPPTSLSCPECSGPVVAQRTRR